MGKNASKITYYNDIVKKIKNGEAEFEELLPYIKKAIDLMPETFNLNGFIYGYDDLNSIYNKLSDLSENLTSTKKSITSHISKLKAEDAAEAAAIEAKELKAKADGTLV